MLAIACLLSTTSSASGNQLQPGSPTIEDNQYTFPVYLVQGSGQVAALDFRFDYDPGVFRPVGVSAGVMAEQANKIVSANVPAPGGFKVVVMGLNQTALADGEVARIALERIGDASGAVVQVSAPHAATPDGEPAAADGGSHRLPGDSPRSDGHADTDSGTREDDGLDEPGGGHTVTDGNGNEETSTGFSPGQLAAALPAALRETLEDGHSVDGWERAEAAVQSAREEIEEHIPPSATAEAATADAQAGTGAAQRGHFVPPSEMRPEQLAQAKAGPVTIESEPSSENSNSALGAASGEMPDAAPARRRATWPYLTGLGAIAAAVVGGYAATRRKTR